MTDSFDQSTAAWATYDPATAQVHRDPANATGVELEHLRRFPRNGLVSQSHTVYSNDRRTRVQVLSDRVVRVEHCALDADLFEDRPSFCFSQRGRVQKDCRFEVEHVDDAALVVQTAVMRIQIHPALDSGLRNGGLKATVISNETSEQSCEASDMSQISKQWPTRLFVGNIAEGQQSADEGDLMGTCRTLDGVEGYNVREWIGLRKLCTAHLGDGLLSRRYGLVFIDDSSRPLFTDDGWFASRPQTPENAHYSDCYVLASGLEYQQALSAFTKVAGDIPLIPRRYLGNWWSRFHAYNEQELTQLVTRFQCQVKVPLSMLVIDMDWHLVSHEDGVVPESAGWTGYTWNRRLFPDPSRFITWVHRRNIGTALNLHPAGPICAHEENYETFGRYLGATALASQRPIPFDPTDPMVVSAYFATLIRPLEETGGELAKCSWWLDWQQGTESRLKGIDPLFLINHLHFADMAREQGRERRPVIFSRYAGLGSHRTPIGFSGDTHSTWASLAFQPYMTHSASNAAFPYWSHDIGGHTRGIQDDELYARWVQWGALSPILRLHSSDNPFCLRMPWSFSPAACMVACDAMRLRHQLIPYMYSSTWKTHLSTEPLLKPMYYVNPRAEDAYAAPAQYWFGQHLVAAPITSPSDPETGLSRQIVWLPSRGTAQGEQSHLLETSEAPWRHLFTGEALSAGWHCLYADLSYLPLFAPPGAIIPMSVPRMADARNSGGLSADDSAIAADFNDVRNPEAMFLHVVAGASGGFDLYEDEETNTERVFLTKIHVEWFTGGSEGIQITVEPPLRLVRNASEDGFTAVRANESDLSNVLPNRRFWRIRVIGMSPSVCATLHTTNPEGSIDMFPAFVDEETESVVFDVPPTSTTSGISLTVSKTPDSRAALISERDRVLEKCETLLSRFTLGCEKKMVMSKMLPELVKDVSKLRDIATFEQIPDLSGTLFTVTPKMKQALLETIDGCGSGRNFLACPGAPAVAWRGKTGSFDAELVLKDDAGREVVERLSSASSQAIVVEPQPNAVALRVVQNGFLETIYPLRDPDDFTGPPSSSVRGLA